MKKIDFKVFMLMLLALLFADVVPAAERNVPNKLERLWCEFLDCEGPPESPTPRPDSAKPKPASKTTTEKR